MMKKLLPTFALLLAVFMMGCGAQGGKTVYTQGANAAAVMGTAPESGVYQLYTTVSPNPTTTVRLNEGDTLGFRKSSEGQIEGVAGDQAVTLPKGTAQAYWKLKKEKKDKK